MVREWIERKIDSHYFDITVRYSDSTKNVTVENNKTGARTRLNMKICERVYRNCEQTSFEWFTHFLRDADVFAELKPNPEKAGFDLAALARNNGIELTRVIYSTDKPDYSYKALWNECLLPFTRQV